MKNLSQFLIKSYSVCSSCKSRFINNFRGGQAVQIIWKTRMLPYLIDDETCDHFFCLTKSAIGLMVEEQKQSENRLRKSVENSQDFYHFEKTRQRTRRKVKWSVKSRTTFSWGYEDIFK